MFQEMFPSSKIHPQLEFDQVDGGRLRLPGGDWRKKHKSGGTDSAYNSDDSESHFSDSTMKPTQVLTKKQRKRLKEKKTITHLVTSLTTMGFDEAVADVDSTISSIPPMAVRLYAATSRCHDSQLRVNLEAQVDGFPQTSEPVYHVSFDAYNSDDQAILLWKNNTDIEGGTTYNDANFLMKGPSPSSPKEPSPEEPDQNEPEPDSPKEPDEREVEPPSPEDPPSLEESVHKNPSEVDAHVVRTESSVDEDEFKYRLARINVDGDMRVVAVHINDIQLKKDDGSTPLFSMQWKVVRDGQYVLHDPVQRYPRSNNLVLEVTCQGVAMTTVNEYPDTMQNPNTLISIWNVKLNSSLEASSKR